jgi:hypothetical protein
MKTFWLYFPFALALVGAYVGWTQEVPTAPIWLKFLMALTGFIILGGVGQYARKLFSKEDFGD